MSAQNNLPSFYYTFGTSERFPYQGGWTEVKAANREEADRIFRSHHPDRSGGILNCAFVYDQAAFEQMQREAPTPSNWSVCHEVLSAQEDRLSHWSEIRNDYLSENVIPEQDGALRASITIGAWQTQKGGSVIATVFLSEHGDIIVGYQDNIARWDPLAQESIQDAIRQLEQYAKEQGINRPEPQSEVTSELRTPIWPDFTSQVRSAQTRAGKHPAAHSVQQVSER